MPKYRKNLPQLSGCLFLTDRGVETSLIYLQGFDLPLFAAFDLFRNDAGVAGLRAYFKPYLEIARQRGLGIVLESPTWRSNTDWGARLGYGERALDQIRCRSIDLLVDLRREYETEASPVVISGCIGPRGDRYKPETMMAAADAEAYHALEVATFARSEADLVTAITMNHAEEAIGIARACAKAGIPSVISFTVETDGHLPTGQSLKDAIAAVDAATDAAPAYYMINCAHPAHFEGVIAASEAWTERIRGLRANASRKSHAELDAATVLDSGDPYTLANEYRDLRRKLRRLNVMGGCCGTDHRHIAEIALACTAA